MGATVLFASSPTGAATTSITIAPGSVAVGDRQYVIVESSTADAHVWPAAWTVLVSTAGETGYVSIATRVRQVGDPANFSVSNGGHSANWSATAVYVESTGGHTPSVVSTTSKIDVSGTSMTVPASAQAGGQYTILWLSSATFADVPSFSPFTNQIGASGTPLVVWWPHITPGSPGYTITRTSARVTVSLLVLLTESLTYVSNVINDGIWVRGHGYNSHASDQEAWGGSIQIL